MKKTMLYVSAALLTLTFTACGRDAGEADSTEESRTQESSAVAESVPGTQESSAAGTEETAPEESGTGGGAVPFEGWSEEMDSLKAAVTAAVGEENYWPDMEMDPEMFETFVGISPELYEDYLAESPMVSVNVDTLVIVKAKADQADAVEEALNTYRDGKVNDTMQYPMNLGKIQASMVERIGDYVIFVQLGAETPDDEEASITQCKEANETALEAIRGILEDASAQ